MRAAAQVARAGAARSAVRRARDIRLGIGRGAWAGLGALFIRVGRGRILVGDAYFVEC
jgi:hypothetical protein